ncbi:MAG: hypothetical protein ACRD4K_14735 [Candidatus Acidiferrales bacterium]
MQYMFDIFKRLPDGTPLWVEAVPGLVEAKQRIARLAFESQSEYFIFSVRDGGIVALVTQSEPLPVSGENYALKGQTIH